MLLRVSISVRRTWRQFPKRPPKMKGKGGKWKASERNEKAKAQLGRVKVPAGGRREVRQINQKEKRGKKKGRWRRQERKYGRGGPGDRSTYCMGNRGDMAESPPRKGRVKKGGKIITVNYFSAGSRSVRKRELDLITVYASLGEQPRGRSLTHKFQKKHAKEGGPCGASTKLLGGSDSRTKKKTDKFQERRADRR